MTGAGPRRIARRGLIVGAALLIAGLFVAGGAAVSAGDWGLAPEPWIGIGLTLTVAGLAMTAVFAVIVDLLEPLGWLRLLVLPPALALGTLWGIYLVVGQATTGYGGPERDLRTVFYSEPKVLIWFIALTGSMAVALAIASAIKRRRTIPSRDA